jgi:hypothetical protein
VHQERRKVGVVEQYAPPTGDHEPLDPIEHALVRALVAIIVRDIRHEAGESNGAGNPERKAG